MKPNFFLNEQLATLPFEWRLLFAGLWTQADRSGRLEDRPLRLKASLFPYDDVDIEAGLESLEATGLIVRYQVDHHRLIAIPTWEKHQQPHVREPLSQFPAPPADTLAGIQAQQGTPAPPPELAGIVAQGAPDHGEESSAPGQHRAGPSDPDPDPDPDQGTDPDRGTDPVPGAPPPTRARETRTRADGAPPMAVAASTVRERFDRFWEAYPRREGRGAAWRRWEQLKPDEALLSRMLAAIDQQRQRPQWLKDDGQFIPHPATWLNQERWLDEGVERIGATVSHTTRVNLANAEVAKRYLRSRT